MEGKLKPFSLDFAYKAWCNVFQQFIRPLNAFLSLLVEMITFVEQGMHHALHAGIVLRSNLPFCLVDLTRISV